MFRTHVIGRANIGARQFWSQVFRLIIFYYPGETEVPQFHVIVVVKEYVAGFEVAMQDLASFDAAVVALSQCQQNLHKYFPYDVLRHEISICLALFDELSHITVLTVLHYYVYLLILPAIDALNIPHNIRMIEFTEAVYFANYLAALFFR